MRQFLPSALTGTRRLEALWLTANSLNLSFTQITHIHSYPLHRTDFIPVRCTSSVFLKLTETYRRMFRFFTFLLESSSKRAHSEVVHVQLVVYKVWIVKKRRKDQEASVNITVRREKPCPLSIYKMTFTTFPNIFST